MNAKPLKIVLADDETNLRMSLRTVFRQAKHKVVAFDNGVDALEYIHDADPEENLALVSDIVMPRLSGLELIREVRRLMPDIPIIAMTGYGDKPMVTELLRAGCDDFLDKPFKPDVMIATLNRIIETRSSYINSNRVRLKAIESMEREFGLELGSFRAAQARESSHLCSMVPPDVQCPFCVTAEGEWQVIQPVSDLTIDVARELKVELERQLSDGQRKFRFNLAAVQDMDALALSVFCALSHELRDCGEGAIQMCEVAAPVQRMFEYLHLESEFGLTS